MGNTILITEITQHTDGNRIPAINGTMATIIVMLRQTERQEAQGLVVDQVLGLAQEQKTRTKVPVLETQLKKQKNLKR